MLAEWTNNVLFGKISNSNDYEDQIRCVEQDEHMRNVLFTSKKSSPIFDVFHLDIEIKTQKTDVKQKSFEKIWWEEIKAKIQIGPKLDQEKTNQLWDLLEQFQDVFVQHKGELGCCKIGEHVIDTQGFPPWKSTPSRLFFWEEIEMKRQIDALVQLGKMKPTTSEYACKVTL